MAHLRAGRQWGLSGSGMVGISSPTGHEIGEQQATASAEMDQTLETVRRLRTCPKCGGDRYKDQRA